MQDESIFQKPKIPVGLDTLHPVPGTTPEPTSWGETFEAAYDLDPVHKLAADLGFGFFTGNLAKNEFETKLFQSMSADYEENYVALTKDIADRVPEEYWPRIMETRNPGERANTIERIENEISNQQTIHQAGWKGYVATLGMEIFNPVNYGPQVVALKFATLGKGFVQNLSRALPLAAASAAIDQSVRLSELETHDAYDAFKGFVIDTVALTAFGGIAGAYKSSKVSMVRADLESKFAGVEVKTRLNDDGTFQKYEVIGDGTLSSMQSVTRVQKLIDEGIADISEEGWRAKVFDTWFGGSPIVRGLRSDFATIREYTNGMFAHNFVTGKIAAGQADAIKAEDILLQYRGKLNSCTIGNRDLYKAYLRENGKTLFNNPEGIKTGKEFNDMVGQAMRRGDRSEIPQVEQAAKLWRSKVFDPLKDEMVRLGRLPEGVDVNTAMSYLTRIYDRQTIVQNRGEFVSVLSDYYKTINNELEQIYAPFTQMESEMTRLRNAKASTKDKKVLSEIRDDMDKIKKSMKEFEASIESKTKAGHFRPALLSEGVLRRVTKDDLNILLNAESTVNTILHEDDQQLAGAMFEKITRSGTPSPLKQRSLLIDDEAIEKFLVSDIERIASVYNGGLSRVAALDNFFGRFGDTATEGRENLVGRLSEEYNQLRIAVEKNPPSAARNKELIKLDKKFQKAKEFVKETTDVFMGTYAMPTTAAGRLGKRVSRLLQDYNVFSRLGYLGVTSLSETTAATFEHGLMNYLNQGLVPLLKNLKDLKRKGSILREDLADADLAINTAISLRTNQVWGNDLEYIPTTKFERGIQNITNMSGNLSLINQLTDVNEIIAGTISQSRMSRNIDTFNRTGKLPQKEIEYMGRIGLDYKKYGKQMAEQIKKHGGSENSAFTAGFSRWDKEANEASVAFSRSLEKSVRNTIIKRNMLDAPIRMNGPLCGLLMQFMGWSFAATNKFVIPTLQRADSDKLTGMLMMTALGALVTPIKQMLRNEEVDVDPAQLAKEAFFNSGFAGWQIEAINKVNSALDLPILRGLQANKYNRKRRTGAEVALGPSAGAINNAVDLLGFVGSVASGQPEMSEKGLKNFMLSIPGLNSPYASHYVNNWIESMNLPSTRAQAQKAAEAGL